MPWTGKMRRMPVERLAKWSAVAKCTRKRRRRKAERPDHIRDRVGRL